MKYIKRFETIAEQEAFNADPPIFPTLQYNAQTDKFDTTIPTLLYYSEDEWNSLTAGETDFSSVPEGICLIYEYGMDESTKAVYDSTTGRLILPSNTVYDSTTGKLTIGVTGNYDSTTGTLKI